MQKTLGAVGIVVLCLAGCQEAPNSTDVVGAWGRLVETVSLTR